MAEPKPPPSHALPAPVRDARDAHEPPTASLLEPGTASPESSAPELLAGRFRILRFLAQGGMGAVYEAEDLELREHVALKIVRPGLARDPQAMERFRREVQLARKVTHPNVCRTFDIGSHHDAAGEVTFVTMELLAGETLAARLRRAGRLSVAEALPLAQQMSAALAAAHKAGVVHRDFKSANVVVVEETGETRAVVTDFGLARGHGPLDAAPVTGTGAIVGTPDYMAPEQVAGGEITPATDVYALGVVLYEMVTGVRPFAGDSPISVALKRLSEPAPSPRTPVPDLDARWEAVILRCLERNPADRFASAEDVARALSGEQLPPGRRVRRRRRLQTAALLALVVVAAAAGYRVRVTRSPTDTGPSSAAPAAVKPRTAVAVLGFRNLSGRPETAWLSTALAQMLTTELSAGEKLRTIPGENVARMKVELSLADAESLAKDTLARVRTNLGTDLVVLGSYLALGKEEGGQIRLDVRLQDAVAGETIASIAETGTEAQFLDLVSRAGARLRAALSVGDLSPAEVQGLQASRPSSPGAARLYAEGLARLRLFDALAARDLLKKAVAAEPGYPLTHAALADAWATLGYDEDAKEEARKASELSERLSREDRLAVEGGYREATGEWEKAIEIYRTLWGFFPDNLEYGLRLARAQTSGGKGREAMRTLESLRKLPPPASGDPRIDLGEAEAAASFGEHKRAVAAAMQAAANGSARGARLLVARAYLLEAYALESLGEQEQAVAEAEKAQQLYSEANDRGGVASALIRRAGPLWTRGDLDAAEKTVIEALGIAREIGDRRNMARALAYLGIVASERGDLRRAVAVSEEALVIFREVGHRRNTSKMLNNIGYASYRRGDLNTANTAYEEGLRIAREIADRDDVAFTVLGLGAVSLAAGDLAAARRSLEEAISEARSIGTKRAWSAGLFYRGQLLRLEDAQARARKSHEEALAIRKEIKEALTTAESQVAIARLLLEEGHPEQAEATARTALEAFRGKSTDGQALAGAALARALLAQGKTAEAQTAVAGARALAAKSQDIHARLSVAIAAAQVLAAGGKTGEASQLLEAGLAEASKLGLVPWQHEIRFALGQVEIRAGRAAAGRVRLEVLEKEARTRGFGLIARKAATARSALTP